MTLAITYLLGGSLALVCTGILAAALIALSCATYAAARGVGMLVAILIEPKPNKAPRAVVSRRTLNERYRDFVEAGRAK